MKRRYIISLNIVEYIVPRHLPNTIIAGAFHGTRREPLFPATEITSRGPDTRNGSGIPSFVLRVTATQADRSVPRQLSIQNGNQKRRNADQTVQSILPLLLYAHRTIE